MSVRASRVQELPLLRVPRGCARSWVLCFTLTSAPPAQVSDKADPSELVSLIAALNPNNTPGRLAVIVRMGANKVLPASCFGSHPSKGLSIGLMLLHSQSLKGMSKQNHTCMLLTLQGYSGQALPDSRL